jgi:IS30 family transposase
MWSNETRARYERSRLRYPSDQEIQEIVLTTNLTPRKCLGFKTPFQALFAELGKDVQIRFS